MRRAWGRSSGPLVAVVFCVALVVGCGQQASPDEPGNTDSGTGFGKLEHCDATRACAEGLSCLCNVCTVACAGDGDCGVLGADSPLTCVGPEGGAAFEAQCGAYAEQAQPPEGGGLCLASCGAEQGGVCPGLPEGAAPESTTPDQCVEEVCTGLPESVSSSVRPSPLLEACVGDGDCGEGWACVCSVCTRTCGGDGECAGASAELGVPLVCVSGEDAARAGAFEAQCGGRASEVVPEGGEGVCLAACRADLTCQNTGAGEAQRPDVCEDGACVDPCEAALGWEPSNVDLIAEPQWRGEPGATYRLDMALSNRGRVEEFNLRLCHHDRLPLEGSHGLRFEAQTARHGTFTHETGATLEPNDLCSIWVFWPDDTYDFVQGDVVSVRFSATYPLECRDDWGVDCSPQVDAPCGTCWAGEAPVLTRTCAPGPP